MSSLTVRKDRMNRSIDPEKLIRGELERAFGLDPEDLDIGTEKEAAVVLEEKEEEWTELPVVSPFFFENYIREPMFPIQQELCDPMLGEIPTAWPDEYNLGFALWGKGSGKDRTSAKMCCYVTYKLMCMRNPHKSLEQGEDDAIDVANMSKNSRQAKNVYFGKLKSVIRRCRDPHTGKNWFELRGVDLREKRDIQSAEIKFTGPQNTVSHIKGEIKAHSLDSEVYTGEGYNLLFVVLDELGSFRVQQGMNLHTALDETITSRYGDIGKLVAISFMYAEYDAMQILMAENLKIPGVFISGPHSTWKVNLFRKQRSFAKHYKKNPVRAKRVYECEVDKSRSGFIKLKSVISGIFDEGIPCPVIGGHRCVGFFPEIIGNPMELGGLEFLKDFKPKEDALYTAHVDLAKGKQKGDSIGFALAHPEKMKVNISKQVRKLLIQMGHIAPDEEKIGKGVVFDLLLAIRGPDATDEARFAHIRERLLYKLIFELGFPILKVTYDGYQSVESTQQLEDKGIPTELLSVDKTNDPFENMAELAYQGLLKTYPHFVAFREIDEVDINDKGKVDHPVKSMVRLLQEGLEKGSKDVADAMAATAWTSINEIPVDVGIFIG